jgi:plastocyanin
LAARRRIGAFLAAALPRGFADAVASAEGDSKAPSASLDRFDRGRLRAAGGVTSREGAGGGGLAPWAVITGCGTVAGALAAAAFAAFVAAAAGGADYRISQRDRAFMRSEIGVLVGDTIHFDNNDDIIHQIYVKSSDFHFDSAESDPGDTIEVTFSKPGIFYVRCHIHPKMSLQVTVK